MTSWLMNGSELCYTLVTWACSLLIYSTPVICAGLLVNRILGPGRAALRSSVVRFVLGAAFVCPYLGLLSHAQLVQIYLPLETPSYSYVASQRSPSLPEAGRGPAYSHERNSSLNHTATTVTPHDHRGGGKSSLPGDARVFPESFAVDLAILYGTLSALWLGGTLFLLIRLGGVIVQTGWLRRQTTWAPEVVSAQCRQLAWKIGVRPPAVLISRNISSPVLAGVLKPAILLPASFSHETNEQVLTHELAHLQRRDCVWNLMGRLITTLYFFQPLLWILIRQLEETSEEVCDGYVLFYTGKRTHYARRLVEMAEELGFCSQVGLAAIGVIGLRSSLGRRVERILDSAKDSPIRTPKHTLVSIHSIGIVVVLLLSLLGIRSAGSGQRARWQSFNASRVERDVSSKGCVQELLESLSNRDANERARSVQILGSMDTQVRAVIPHILERLEDEDWLVRKAAAQALAYMGSEARSAVIPLTKSLSDPQWLVRESSAYGLAAIAPSTHAPVAALIWALDDPEWQVRMAAAVALTALGSSATPAVPRLSGALLDPEWQVRRPAAQALAAIGPQAFPAVSNLIQTLGDEEWQVRQHAGAALAAIGPRARPAVSQLVVLLNDEEWQVRRNAARALGAIGPEAASAIPALLKCLDDPQWHCRHAATGALEKTARGDKTAIPVIVEALLDPEWNKRKIAARSLQGILHP